MCCTSIITAGQLARTAAMPAPNGLQQAGTSKSRDLTPALLRCQTRRNLPADQRKPSSIACQSPRRFSSRASAAPAVPETQSQCLWQVTGDLTWEYSSWHIPPLLYLQQEADQTTNCCHSLCHYKLKQSSCMPRFLMCPLSCQSPRHLTTVDDTNRTA